ncbi:MAG: DNA mismatch repair protein MutS [Anaerolineae bacterium]|nr:DNA mismatch repair protein MutS [Anaerolineae bacterium]
MDFHSILFKRIEDYPKDEALQEPAFFSDLNLDQIIESITISKQEYNLKHFFYTPLKDVDSIKYRHEVTKDLENKTLFENIKSFAQKIHAMREHLEQARKLYYKYQKERWFLDAVEIYCDAVTCLVHNLSSLSLNSRGFKGFLGYLIYYTNSDRFVQLVEETKKLEADLSAIKYCLTIRDNSVKVQKYRSEIDYSAEVEKTFQKFKEGVAKDYKVNFPEQRDMNHIEAKILDLVALLYPDIFLNLDNYCHKNADYLDDTICRFDREIQFYIAYLEHIEIFKRAKLNFCYPRISKKNKEIYNYDGFDLALAYKLITEKSSIVRNDFYLKEKERIIIVSGPNQGGKTTFARTFGQLHYLASLGCPVPGKKAQLYLYDHLFTHFEREEDIKNLRGKLEDDLLRIYDILNHATTHSLIIMNEIFTSTTLEDAVFLSKKVMEKIIQLDLLCVCVTFLDELSLLEKTVSMVSTVVPENPTVRTFKVVRKPADGLAYAVSIAEKYQLTFDFLKERLNNHESTSHVQRS